MKINLNLHIDWKAVVGAVGMGASFVVQYAPVITQMVGANNQHVVATAVQIASGILLLLSETKLYTPPAAPTKPSE